MPHNRTFINHPQVGTLLLRKTRPGYKNYRHRIIDNFVGKLKNIGAIPYGWSECKICGTMLINPHSILTHIGNCCEAKTVTNALPTI